MSGAKLRLVGALNAASDVSFSFDSEWHQMGFVYFNGEVRFYVDGSLFGTPRTAEASVPAQSVPWHLIQDTQVGTNPRIYWHNGGYDDAVLLYDVALTAFQMNTLHAQGAACVFNARIPP